MAGVGAGGCGAAGAGRIAIGAWGCKTGVGAIGIGPGISGTFRDAGITAGDMGGAAAGGGVGAEVMDGREGVAGAAV